MGTDETHITAQGAANADVVGKDGVTTLDALEIQKYVAELITSFED